MRKTSTIKRPTLKALYEDTDLCVAIAGHMTYNDPKRGSPGGFRSKFIYNCFYNGVSAAGNDTRMVVKSVIRKLREAKRI